MHDALIALARRKAQATWPDIGQANKDHVNIYVTRISGGLRIRNATKWQLEMTPGTWSTDDVQCGAAWISRNWLIKTTKVMCSLSILFFVFVGPFSWTFINLLQDLKLVQMIQKCPVQHWWIVLLWIESLGIPTGSWKNIVTISRNKIREFSRPNDQKSPFQQYFIQHFSQ